MWYTFDVYQCETKEIHWSVKKPLTLNTVTKYPIILNIYCDVMPSDCVNKNEEKIILMEKLFYDLKSAI